MTDLRAAMSAQDMYEMNTIGNAIGCVYQAANEHAAQPRNPLSAIRLNRTIAIARVRGVDENTITDTIRQARKETQP